MQAFILSILVAFKATELLDRFCALDASRCASALTAILTIGCP